MTNSTLLTPISTQSPADLDGSAVVNEALQAELESVQIDHGTLRKPGNGPKNAGVTNVAPNKNRKSRALYWIGSPVFFVFMVFVYQRLGAIDIRPIIIRVRSFTIDCLIEIAIVLALLLPWIPLVILYFRLTSG